MPELPEVESVARMVRVALTGPLASPVSAVELLDQKLLDRSTSMEALYSLAGTCFGAVSRSGKYLIIRMDGREVPLYLILHLRMTGRIMIVSAGGEPARHTRLRIVLRNGAALLFDDPRRFGQLWVTHAPHDVVGTLGPDALTVSLETFSGVLSRVNRQLKPLLLDQRVIAGIGNIYADEILFRARLHPLAVSGSLAADDVSRLHGAVVSILAEAVQAGGANIDGVFKAGEFPVMVYGRSGQPCYACGLPVSKIRVAQRGTHICSGCQKLASDHSGTESAAHS